MKKYLYNIMILSALFVHPLFAATQTSDSFNSLALMINVIQDQFVFAKKTIQNATIVKNSNGVYSGLRIELKPEFVNQFVALTGKSVGKQLDIVFGDRIITITRLKTPLGRDIMISGISEQDANLFIDMLRKT